MLHAVIIFLCFIELALSLNDTEVKIFKKNSGKWQETATLAEHGQRVTGIDWAPKSNRIVTCGAVSVYFFSVHQ